MLEDYIVGTR